MYQEPNHIYSSYAQNNIGETIYNVVRDLKPKRIIDFGLLYGYSTVCLAQAVRDNGIGHVYGYDLFEDYKYKNSPQPIVEYNLQYYGLQKYTTLIKKDFNEWLTEEHKFDLLHLDISNNGDIIKSVFNKYPNKPIIFEGGISDRDEIDWMVKYNATPINNIQKTTGYKILNERFPGLSSLKI